MSAETPNPSTIPSPGHAQQPAVETPRTVLISSTLGAVFGSMLMVLVHEGVHLLTGIALGNSGTLYPFGVDHHGTRGPAAVAITAISAPIFSLVSGVVCAFWMPFKRRGGFGQLLWFWFAFTSIMEGVGYLVITPMGAGDTAATADALGWPMWPRLVAFAVGAGLMFVAARMFSPFVRRYAGSDRPRQWALAFWPWLLASAVNMLLAFTYLTMSRMSLSAGETIAIMSATMAVYVCAPMSFMFLSKVADVPYEPLGLKPIPVGGLIAFGVMVVVNLLLTRGLTLG